MARPGAVRIVIAGGGFGGVYAAAYLARSELKDLGAEITLLDSKNYFTFTPLLAEVAAGTLGREHVTYPYRVLASKHGFDFRQAAVQSLDPSARVIRTSRFDLSYDYLILATGAEPQFFGNKAIEKASLSFTSVNQALAIRGRVMESLERMSYTADEAERRRLLTFVVAGAGPAGVEIAGEIQHLASHVLKPFFPEIPPVRVVVADAGTRILVGFDEQLAEVGIETLRSRGIDVRLETRIVDASDGLVVAEGPEGRENIAAHTLIWTAGTAPGSWVETLPVKAGRGGIEVDEFLCARGFDNVFAVGDVAMLIDKRTGKPFPKVAPIAISQGVRAAANIENHYLGREFEPYQAFHAGKIVSLGGGVALVEILGIRFTGVVAWWIYRLAYILKLLGAKNKIRVLVTLVLNRIFEPDLTYEEAESGV